ncbi:MAG: hypothetical protein ACTHN5_24110 [Phycisphaerae bacterium]
MLKIAVLLLAACSLVACETKTVRQETDEAPTEGMIMRPPNERGPARPIDQVTDPNRQIPTNSPGRY